MSEDFDVEEFPVHKKIKTPLTHVLDVCTIEFVQWLYFQNRTRYLIFNEILRVALLAHHS